MYKSSITFSEYLIEQYCQLIQSLLGIQLMKHQRKYMELPKFVGGSPHSTFEFFFTKIF